MSAAQQQPANGHDLQLLSAGQTIELLSRLLGAAVAKLGGTFAVASQDLRALDDQELLHGEQHGIYVVKLAPKADHAADAGTAGA